MNIKAYIDYFSEISHLKREQQFDLLEQAHDDACSGFKILTFTNIAVLIRMIFILFLPVASYLLFSYPVWVLMVTIFLGVLISRVAVSEISSHLLLKSLKKVLRENPL
ncbi:hypothetical protein ACVFI8_19305 [Agarivorans sp. MS3-6]|uniref:hypothetical protein n=1 Tax=Agarivorans sp. TSD2052 TaxID=2937286 RepID=UPI00200E1C16|nr:hypothetical protein [Agarivorans sp. TSD2052]UPW17013.1 hypothetical protein M0C34_12225 [Agarivorans sp. TSD2052]